MSEHTATLTWQRRSDAFTYETYNRDHNWKFDGGHEMEASAAPAYLGNPAHVDPEEAYIASLSSCHLLTFLALACKKRFVVESYVDHPVGVLEKGTDGRMAITRLTLRPQVVFGGEKLPDAAALDALHHAAHENCFIANSVKTVITVEPRTDA